jgi:integrase
MSKNDIIEKFELAILKKSPVSLKLGAAKIDLYISDSRDGTRFTVAWYEGAKRKQFGTTRGDSALEKIKGLVTAAELGEQAAKKISYQRVQEFLEADTILQGVNLAELVTFYKSHVRAQSSATVEEVAALYIEAAKDKSLRYRQTLQHYMSRLCGAFKGVQISSIRATDLDEYLIRSFPNLKTRLNHRGAICSLFTFAQRKNFLPAGSNEAKKTERPASKCVEPCVVSSDCMIKLLDICVDKRIAAFLVLQAFAGCRAAEVIRMQWKHIKEDSVVLPPEITKTNRRRVSEMPPNLVAWLAPMRGEADEFVTYPESFHVYRRSLQLFRKAGIKREGNALRHTFVSCHLEKHCDPPKTAKTAGHSLTVLEQHYLKLVSKKDAEDWFNIFPPEEKTYVEPVIRTQRPYRPGRKTWRQIAAARNATVKATKTKQQQQPTEKKYNHA